MLIALIVAALVAVALAVLYVLERNSAAEGRRQADERETALRAERDQLSGTLGERERELASIRTERDELDQRLDQRTTELDATRRDLEATRATADDRQATITELTAETGQLTRAKAALESKVEAAEKAAAAAEARAQAVAIAPVDGDADDKRPETLWNLELTRSERTWRTSVATNPNGESPFAATDDPVRTAIEIEAAALRENVGASISLDWQAAPSSDPARSHLVVRVAQELLEAAARSPEPTRLVATGNDVVTLRLTSVDDDKVVDVTPPAISSDLIDVTDDAATISVDAQ